jgi:uncharacterized protein
VFNPPWDLIDFLITSFFVFLLALPISAVVVSLILKVLAQRKKAICQTCDNRLEKLPNNALTESLNPAQKMARKLKHTRYEGWHCEQCFPDDLSNFHLRRYIFANSEQECPHCEEFTKNKKSKVLVQPTYHSTGTRLITYTCQICHHSHERREVIAQLTQSSGSGGSDGGSGGGSFGGGSSGGGGAGDSY